MGLHLCPIEPDDWSNGPNDEEGEECPACGGSGEIIGESDQEKTCKECGGSGFKEPDDSRFDDDVI